MVPLNFNPVILMMKTWRLINTWINHQNGEFTRMPNVATKQVAGRCLQLAHRSYSTRILKFGREVWEKTIGTLTKYASTVQTQAHRRTFMLIWLTEFGASLNLLCCCLVRCHFSITITLYHARWRDFVKIHLPYNQFLSKNLEDYSNYSTSRHKNCYQHYLVPDNIYPISSAPKTR